MRLEGIDLGIRSHSSQVYVPYHHSPPVSMSDREAQSEVSCDRFHQPRRLAISLDQQGFPLCPDGEALREAVKECGRGKAHWNMLNVPVESGTGHFMAVTSKAISG